MNNQNEMASIIENNVFSEAERLIRDRVLPLSATAGFVLENNGSNADFDNVYRDAIELYNALVNSPEYTRYQLTELAQFAATDAFQAYAYQVALGSPNLLHGVSREDEALLGEILNRVNMIMSNNQRPQRHSGQYGQQRPYSNGTRREEYPTGNRGMQRQYQNQRHYSQPRNNAVHSSHGRPTANSRYGQPASGSNIGRSGGGFGQVAGMQHRQPEPQQQPPQQQGRPTNVINIHRQPDLGRQPAKAPEPPPMQKMTVVQTRHHRPSYGIGSLSIAPILYDQEVHIPLYTLEREGTGAPKCTGEIIIEKDSDDGKKILGGNMEGHVDYLFVPRAGENKSTDLSGKARATSALSKLIGDTASFRELNEQLEKDSNNVFKAKDGAVFPEIFKKRLIELDETLYGNYSNDAERMFRTVEYVNQRIAPINPDVDYDQLVVAGTTRDLLPFVVNYPSDVQAIDRLLDYFRAHQNPATCLEVMRKLEIILPTREWNTINDLATKVVSDVGIVEFGLPEGITNFTDQVQKYIKLVDTHFGRANAELISQRIYDVFKAVFNPIKVGGTQYTFNLDYRVVLLPLLSNDLNYSTSIPDQRTAIVSSAVMPDLHAALSKQLDMCADTTLGLLLYTRDAHAIQVHRSPLGGEILINLHTL